MASPASPEPRPPILGCRPWAASPHLQSNTGTQSPPAASPKAPERGTPEKEPGGKLPASLIFELNLAQGGGSSRRLGPAGTEKAKQHNT